MWQGTRGAIALGTLVWFLVFAQSFYTFSKEVRVLSSVISVETIF